MCHYIRLDLIRVSNDIATVQLTLMRANQEKRRAERAKRGERERERPPVTYLTFIGRGSTAFGKNRSRPHNGEQTYWDYPTGGRAIGESRTTNRAWRERVGE